MRLRNILILLAILLVLGGYFSFTNRPQPAPEPEPKLFVWLIEMEEIQHIEIRLPRENESQAFIKKADSSWYFDDPQRSPVDMQRWGGISLLLSGPGANRVIARNATPEKLAEFSLTQPQMEITLTLEDGGILNITIGDRTPDGSAFYVQSPGSNDVALVDYTWYEVLERLVKEPPYAPTMVPHITEGVASNENKVILFQSPNCSCCEIYKDYLKEQGFQVETTYTEDMSSIKKEHQIPQNMESCHTAIIEGYIVEGHVPIEAIKKLLEERPEIDGIALPGMPLGSPGMPGQQTEAFKIYALSDGTPSEFMTINE